MAPAAARQSSMERPSHCSLGSQVVTRDKKPMLLSGCGMYHPPSLLICEAFSSESCQHPALSTQHPASNTQHCAVILILEAISYPTLTTPCSFCAVAPTDHDCRPCCKESCRPSPTQTPSRVFHCRSAGIRTHEAVSTNPPNDRDFPLRPQKFPNGYAGRSDDLPCT
jgi:hypothetical protein